MPLVRFELRNEYGLGVSQLYDDAQDPKAILDGVAVAGLVGLLRQLGDLADFAAEVFHGLQEQVASTACRSRKLMARMHKLEASLAPVEKAILSQTGHIHFAYTPGSKWHAHVRNEQNHFIYSDLPQFIMDSYEDSREPPRLQWLDKFDAGGPGSCLKRYSDPSFFRRVSVSSIGPNNEKYEKEKKARKMKKRRSQKFNRQPSFFNTDSGIQFASPTAQGPPSPAQTVSTFDMKVKSDHWELSDSIGSREEGMGGFTHCGFPPSTSEELDEVNIMESYPEANEQIKSPLKSVYSDEQAALVLDETPCSAPIRPDDVKTMESYSGADEQINSPHHAVYFEEPAALGLDDTPCHVEQEKYSLRSPGGTWYEKTESVEATGLYSGVDGVQDLPSSNLKPLDVAFERLEGKDVNQLDNSDEGEVSSKLISQRNEHDEIASESENFVDALNTIESESESEFNFQMKREGELCSTTIDGLIGPSISKMKGEIVEKDPAEKQTLFVTDNQVSNGVLSSLDVSNSSSVVTHESFQGAKPSSSPLEEEQSQNLVDSVAPVCSRSENSRENIGTSSVPSLCDIDSFVNYNATNGLGHKSSVCESASNGSTEKNMLAQVDEPISILDSAVQEFPVQSSNVGCAIFWTNGNLLGLEPSKPPDFGVANGLRCGSGNTGNENTVTLLNNNRDGFSVNDQFSASRIDRRLEKFSYAHSASRLHDSNDQGQDNSAVVLPQTEEPASANTQTAITGGNYLCEDQSPFLSSVCRDFHMSAPHISGSLSSDANSKPDQVPVRFREMENGKYSYADDNYVGANLKEQLTSPVDSPPPSPPLELMEISFQPIDGFGTCRLKLRYPDGINDHQGTIDAFPSFQLVPELSSVPHDVGSDSDNDTFCRSYSCLSHDHLSHLSDSDSEVWDSGGTTESYENMLDDGSCRIMQVESVLGHSDHDSMFVKSVDENGTRQSLAREDEVNRRSSSLHLPALDTMSQLPYKEAMIRKSNESAEAHVLQEPYQPPPLPPLQWRISKPESYGGVEGHTIASNGPIELRDPEVAESAVSLQDEPASANHVGRVEEKSTMAMEIKRLAEQKMNGQQRHRSDGNEEDNKGDFLNQIRAKSFNLRRAETSRPNPRTGAAANEAVTAILEKANAIRQAVGSDDGGDDDTWSDT